MLVANGGVGGDMGMFLKAQGHEATAFATGGAGVTNYNYMFLRSIVGTGRCFGRPRSTFVSQAASDPRHAPTPPGAILRTRRAYGGPKSFVKIAAISSIVNGFASTASAPSVSAVFR